MSSSIAVVVLDCLRADYFHEYFDWLPGCTFNQAYSTSHWSIPAHASLLTGKYASEIGTHAKSPTLNVESTLPEALFEDGYKTRLWTQNHQLTAWDGWQERFEEVLKPKELIEPLQEDVVDWSEFSAEHSSESITKILRAVSEALLSDYDTFSSIREGYRRYTQPSNLPLIRRRIRQTTFSQRDFLFLNLMEMHQPYSAPENYSRTETPIEINHLDNYRNSKLDPTEVRTAYEDCARYLSHEYKKMFESLTESFDLIITLADHGEHLGEYGRWSHEYGLAEELTHIPLSIWSETIADNENSTPVSLIDIPETIADYSSLDFSSRGQSLLSDVNHKRRLTEYHGVMAFQEPKFREEGLAEEFSEADVRRSGIVLSDGYAYEDERGFCITGNINEEEAKSYLKHLRDSVPWERGDDDWTHSDNQFVDKDTKARLKDLGYI